MRIFKPRVNLNKVWDYYNSKLRLFHIHKTCHGVKIFLVLLSIVLVNQFCFVNSWQQSSCSGSFISWTLWWNLMASGMNLLKSRSLQTVFGDTRNVLRYLQEAHVISSASSRIRFQYLVILKTVVRSRGDTGSTTIWAPDLRALLFQCLITMYWACTELPYHDQKRDNSLWLWTTSSRSGRWPGAWIVASSVQFFKGRQAKSCSFPVPVTGLTDNVPCLQGQEWFVLGSDQLHKNSFQSLIANQRTEI